MGWKVDLAQRAKANIERESTAADDWAESMGRWKNIFSHLNGDEAAKQVTEVKPEAAEPADAPPQ